MSQPAFEPVGDGVVRIETGLYRDGLAACYLIRSGDRLAFVDTGTEHTVPRLLEAIAALSLTPAQVEYVIPTHAHLDHAGGAGALMASCPNARLVAHPKGAPHLIDPSKLSAGAAAVYGESELQRHFGRLRPVPEERVIAAGDGQTLDLAGRELLLLDTPGHANHHLCVVDRRTRGIFTGDTFGISYREFDTAEGPWLYAPTTPVAFDPDAWQASIDRLLEQAPLTLYLTHYGCLDAPERHADMLRASIREQAELALAEEGREPAERPERLQQAVGAYLLARAHAHGAGLGAERMRELLAVDTALNAQGLEVWLQRRARRAAEATHTAG